MKLITKLSTLLSTLLLLVNITNSSAQSCVTITQPAALTASITGTNILCNGASTGAANLTVSGGTTPYTYLWSNTATTQNISGVTAGNYTVTVTDANLCTKTATVTITQPTALTASITGTNILCNGANTGAANLTVSGGTSPYSYLWSNNATTQNISGVTAGNYTVTVTDANLCTAVANVTITQPSALTASITGTNVLCNGASTGAANLTVNGGTSPYSYLWSNNATTQNISGVTAGNYTVTVTDANLCTKTATVTITQPTALTASITGTNILCNGANTGTANLTVSGGTTPYTYLWSNNATTQNISGVTAGNYTVTVTDANLCTKTASITITQPSAINLICSKIDITINGGSDGQASVNATGGTSPYTYLWSNNQTTSTITGLTAGNYTVTVTDANSCTQICSSTVNQPGCNLSANTNSTHVKCFGGSDGMATVVITGNIGAVTYLWSNGATTQSITGLSIGTYTVTVTESASCSATANITITQPTALAASITGTNILCNGANTGAANLTVSGGTTPYTYLWSNNATTQNISGVTAGNYTVTVTDANLCTKTATVTITQPTALSFTTTQSNVKCFGGNDATITINGTGGTTPYLFSLDDALTFPNSTGIFSGLTAGSYKPAIKDSNGCIIKCQ